MTRRERNKAEDAKYRDWKGAYRPYDLIKEASIAIGVVTLIALILTILFSSPDLKPSTIKQWSRSDPVDFVTTAVGELDGSSGTAGYGPPYNHNADGQNIAFIHLAKWFGVSHPINTTEDYVLTPLSSVSGNPALTAAIATYRNASSDTQTKWTDAYTKAVADAKANPDGSITMASGNFGPVPTLMNSLLTFAQGGGLDGALLTSNQFFQTDYTKPLLLMADGGLLASRAQDQHLLGSQWGMMNETGSYPGQSWLWLYTFWYQIKPFSDPGTAFGASADLYVMAIMGVLSVLFIAVPFLPGVRSLPRKVGIYKLIWRDHYRGLAT
jgi:hypothetical protein